MYITDILRITVREGSGSEFKIIDVIESGHEVEVISTVDEWAKVRLPNGKEGWLIAKYLTPKKSGGTDFRKLQGKEALLDKQDTVLKTENRQLRDELKKINLQLSESRQVLAVTADSFETLKKSSGNYIEIEKKYNEAEKKLSSQKKKIDYLEEENIRLSRQQNYIWLLTGAGILLVGFIIGYNARRDKRRSSLL
jgi:SH3 domain protein